MDDVLKHYPLRYISMNSIGSGQWNFFFLLTVRYFFFYNMGCCRFWGTPITVSSVGGGSTSGLPWDGRRPDEEEETYRRRCLLFAVGMVKRQNGMRSYRRK